MTTGRRAAIGIAFGVALGILARSLLWTVRVETAAMAPLLWPGDVVLFTVGAPVPGAVVAFREGAETRVSRVVAGAGQWVAVRKGVLFLDGGSMDAGDRAELTAPWSGCREAPVRARAEHVGGRTLWVPMGAGPEGPSTLIGEGAVYLLSDHRAAAEDSRLHGPIAVDAVDGRARLVLWSTDPCTNALRWGRFPRIIQ